MLSLRRCASKGLTTNAARLRGPSRTISEQSSSTTLWQRLLNIPKGFKNFYPKGKADAAGKKPGTKSGDASGMKDAFKRSGGGGGGNGGGGGGDNMDHGLLLFVVFTSVSLGAGYYTFRNMNNSKEISWQEFQSLVLESGQVERLIVTNKKVAKVVMRAQNSKDNEEGVPSDSGNVFSFNESSAVEDIDHSVQKSPEKYIRYPRIGNPQATVIPYHFAIGSVEAFERRLEDAQRALGITSRDFVPVIYANETDWLKEALTFAPTFVFIGLYFLVMRSMSGKGGGMGGGPGGIFNMGKSGVKKINKEMVTTKFSDVAGCDEAKREIIEFVDFLKDPSKFTNLGAKIPKGAMLYGPPGTGKTLLAKAVAGEASVPFFSVSGSDFVEMFVGVGASRVRDLFKEARANAPCIVFIDEIDAVGRKRGRSMGGNEERENTLNQLLVEMDGFDSNSNIVVLAGTNRVDILDAALLRPGRFDRQIQVEKPDIKGRKSIFEVHLKGITLSAPVDTYASRLAALTPGFSGADIANICNEAAIIAARKSKASVEITDFEQATDRVIGGLESKKLISPHEKRVVAYHEAGHAVAGWNLEFADPLLKVTIVPRSNGALGFAQYLPKEIFLRTKDQILDMVCMALAGRAAEQVVFGKYTTGASDDLKRVTQIVYQMVQVYGMNDTIGQLAFPPEDTGGMPAEKLYSNATGEAIDFEVKQIVDEAYKRTLKLMEEKKDQVTKVAELLLAQETITHFDVAKLIGKRPYSSGKEYDEYVGGLETHSVNESASENSIENENTAEGSVVAPTP